MNFVNKNIFAYMRRSTTQDSQANSLFQQWEFIDTIIKDININPEQVQSYIESASGFENRTRKEWQKMLAEIDKSKEPVILLCKDTSRLSRNQHDNLEITDRLYWDGKFYKKPKIEAIYFFDFDKLVTARWDKNTDKELVTQTLVNNYLFSVRQKKLSSAGTIAKLKKWEYPYRLPHGLERVNKKGEPYSRKRNNTEITVLRQTEKMQFIKRAYEMRANGKSPKEICYYLRKYGKISITTAHIGEHLANPLYIWKHILNGVEYSLNFWEKEPPISKDLFERANRMKNNRPCWYGQKQYLHLAPWKFKHEETGKKLTLYLAKWKYPTYGVDFRDGNKRTSKNISEKEIIKEFLDELQLKLDELFFLMDTEINYWLLGELEWYEDLEEEFKEYCFLENQKMDEEDEEILKEYCEMKQLTKKEIIEDNELFNKYMNWKIYKHPKMVERLKKEEIIDNLLLQKCFYIWWFNYDKYKHLDYDEKEDILEELQEEIMKKCEKNKQFERIQQLWEIQRRNSEFIKNIDRQIEEMEMELYKELHKKYKDFQIKVEQRKKKYLKDILQQTPTAQQEIEEEQNNLELAEELQNKIKQKELEKKEKRFDLMMKWFEKNDIDEVEIRMQAEINEMYTELENLKSNTDFKDFIHRIPDIVQNLHELASNTLTDTENDTFRDDLKRLMDYMLHELTLNNKKSLKIELFKGFSEIKNVDFFAGAGNGTRTHNGRHGKAVL